MPDVPFGRVHALALRRDDRGVFCGPDGLFVNSIPLLDCEIIGAGKRYFTPRPLADINRDLKGCYGLPVDAAEKMGGVGAVARALNDGDPARACIAAVFLRLPEIPERTPQALMKCATALAEIGLLKARVDDPKHPGYPAGTEGGKGGQFRPKQELVSVGESLDADQLARGILTKAAANLLKKVIADIVIGTAGSVLGPEVPIAEIAKAIVDLGFAAYEIAHEIAPYVKTYLDEPRTLKDLKDAAKTPRRGYDIHHVVERATAPKDGSEDDFIYGSENLVRISTVKHWELNSWYETKQRKYGRLTPRQYVEGKSLKERYKVGLDGLRYIGVLTP